MSSIKQSKKGVATSGYASKTNVDSVQVTAEQLVADAYHLHRLHCTSSPDVDAQAGQSPFEHSLLRIRSIASPSTRRTNSSTKEPPIQTLSQIRATCEKELKSHPTAAWLWIEYANWEALSGSYARSTSIYRQSVVHNPYTMQLWYRWLSQSEMCRDYEMCNEIVSLWVRNVGSAQPCTTATEHMWRNLVAYACRTRQIDRARSICEQYVQAASALQASKESVAVAILFWVRFETLYGSRATLMAAMKNLCEQPLEETGRRALVHSIMHDHLQGIADLEAFSSSGATSIERLLDMGIDLRPLAHDLVHQECVRVDSQDTGGETTRVELLSKAVASLLRIRLCSLAAHQGIHDNTGTFGIVECLKEITLMRILEEKSSTTQPDDGTLPVSLAAAKALILQFLSSYSEAAAKDLPSSTTAEGGKEPSMVLMNESHLFLLKFLECHLSDRAFAPILTRVAPMLLFHTNRRACIRIEDTGAVEWAAAAVLRSLGGPRFCSFCDESRSRLSSAALQTIARMQQRLFHTNPDVVGLFYDQTILREPNHPEWWVRAIAYELSLGDFACAVRYLLNALRRVVLRSATTIAEINALRNLLWCREILETDPVECGRHLDLLLRQVPAQSTAFLLLFRKALDVEECLLRPLGESWLYPGLVRTMMDLQPVKKNVLLADVIKARIIKALPDLAPSPTCHPVPGQTDGPRKHSLPQEPTQAKKKLKLFQVARELALVNDE